MPTHQVAFVLPACDEQTEHVAASNLGAKVERHTGALVVSFESQGESEEAARGIGHQMLISLGLEGARWVCPEEDIEITLLRVAIGQCQDEARLQDATAALARATGQPLLVLSRASIGDVEELRDIADDCLDDLRDLEPARREAVVRLTTGILADTA